MGNKSSKVKKVNEVSNQDRVSDGLSSSSGQDPRAAGGPQRHESVVAAAADIAPLPLSSQRDVQSSNQERLPPIRDHFRRTMSTQDPLHSYFFRDELNPRQLRESLSFEQNRYLNEPSFRRKTSRENNSDSRYLRRMPTVGDFNEEYYYQAAEPARSGPGYQLRPNTSTGFDDKYQDRESAGSRFDEDRCRQRTPTRFDDESQNQYGYGVRSRFTERDQFPPKTSDHFDGDYLAREEPQNRYSNPHPETSRYSEHKSRPATAATGRSSAWEEREDSPFREQNIQEIDKLYSQLMQNLNKMHNAYKMNAPQVCYLVNTSFYVICRLLILVLSCVLL